MNLVILSTIIATLVASTLILGIGLHALAEDKTVVVNTHLSNTGINVPTHTSQEQNCETAGGSSPIGVITTGSQSSGAGAQKVSPACVASSTDQVTQSGGELKR
jgi:hypothetical protein